MKNIFKSFLIIVCVFAFATPVFAIADYYNLTTRKNLDKNYIKNAIIKYTESINENPKNEDAYINRAFLSYLSDNISQAINDYDILISLNPDNEEFYLNRGYLKHISHKREEALKDYEMALKIKPNYTFALNNRGVVLAELGKKKGVNEIL